MLFGYAINNDPKHLPTAVLGEPASDGSAPAAPRPAAAIEMDAVRFAIGTTVEEAEKGLGRAHADAIADGLTTATVRSAP